MALISLFSVTNELDIIFLADTDVFCRNHEGLYLRTGIQLYCTYVLNYMHKKATVLGIHVFD